MANAAYSILHEAIMRKRQVTCDYHGYHRELCPHVLGLKNGRQKVLSFQFAGESSSQLPPEGQWRCMFVDEITNVASRPGNWHTGDSHKQPQNCVDDIDVEVDY